MAIVVMMNSKLSKAQLSVTSSQLSSDTQPNNFGTSPGLHSDISREKSLTLTI